MTDDSELDKWALGTAFGCRACVLRLADFAGNRFFLVMLCEEHRPEYDRRRDPRRGLQVVPPADEPA